MRLSNDFNLIRIASPSDWALWRAFKLRCRLGSDGGLGERIRKPKGMHRRTFARERARVEEARDVCVRPRPPAELK